MDKFHIDHYKFGSITISGRHYDKDLIILPGQIITGWWRKEGHLLQVEDLAEILDAHPQQLVIGQGAYSRMAVAPAVIQVLEAAGIKWIALPTGKACQVYNQNVANYDIAAALHLTC